MSDSIIVKPQLHASAISMKCMAAFKFRFMENRKIPPGIALVVGTGVHGSIDANLTNKIVTGELLPLDAVTDAARDCTMAAWEAEGVTLQEDELNRGIAVLRGEAIDKSVRLAKGHAVQKAPEINPTFVERPWSLNLPPIQIEEDEDPEVILFDLVGRIDIQEGVSSIRDSKTSSKTPAADCAGKSLQLAAYALAISVLDGHAPEKVWLDYIIDNKAVRCESFSSEIAWLDLQALLKRIALINKMRRLGVFPPVEPDHWCCSARFCGYFSICPYVRHPKQVSVQGG